ncbi:MAG TPA: hypothetical protein VGL48_16050 [Acidimicrobiales bacterium]|jgi:hypothetical protein
MIDLDLMISEADPARSVAILSLDARAAAARMNQLPASSLTSGSLRNVGVGIAAAVVGLGALAYFVLGDSPSNSNAAAATIDRLSYSAEIHSTTLVPGQFLYTQSKAEIEIVVQSSGSAPATAQYPETIQTWVSSQPGRGKVVQTPAGNLNFTSPADEAAWKANPLSPHWTTPPASQGPDEDAVIDESSLPTEPSALLQILAKGQTGIAQVDNLSGPDPTYSRVVALLFSPATGLSPQLEVALYKVLEGLPGIEVVPAQDHQGNRGVEVADSESSELPRLIVDPQTGRPTEIDIPAPSNPIAATPNSTGAFVELAVWTNVVSTSVTTSTTSPVTKTG